MSFLNPRGRTAAPTVVRSGPSLFLFALLMLAAESARTAPPAAQAAPTEPPVINEDYVEDGQPQVVDPVGSLPNEPPDGKWLTDEYGNQYFLNKIKKVKGTYTRMAPDEIKFNFYKVKVDHEDDEWFYIRRYRPTDDHLKLQEEFRRQQEETAARIKAAYQFEERTVDRLSFESFDRGLPRRGQWRQGLEIADINGDGFLDIVHGPPRKGASQPQIYLGDGKGSWRVWSEARWPSMQLDYGDIAVGDVDDDGRLDIALGVHLRGVRVLLQKAAGEFVDSSEGLPFEVPGSGGDASGFSSRAVELVDWNGDGRPDLVGLGEGPRQQQTVDGKGKGLVRSVSFGIVVFINELPKGWRPLSPGAANGLFGDAFALTDLNGDRRLDAATVSYALGRRNIIHLNASDAETGWTTEEIATLRASAWVFGVTAGDFDRDGRDELVTSFATHDGDVHRRGLEISSRDQAGTWNTRLILAYEGKNTIWSLAAGDVDGDRNLDLVASTVEGNIITLLGDGAGNFAREEAPEIDPPALCRGYGLELADLDGNGRAEIVAGFAGESATILELVGTTACETGGALRVWRTQPRPGT